MRQRGQLYIGILATFIRLQVEDLSTDVAYIADRFTSSSYLSKGRAWRFPINSDSFLKRSSGGLSMISSQMKMI
jgi:hypothetical protein